MSEKKTKTTWRTFVDNKHHEIPTGARVHFFTEDGSRIDVWYDEDMSMLRVVTFTNDMTIVPIAMNMIAIKPQ